MYGVEGAFLCTSAAACVFCFLNSTHSYSACLLPHCMVRFEEETERRQKTAEFEINAHCFKIRNKLSFCVCPSRMYITSAIIIDSVSNQGSPTRAQFVLLLLSPCCFFPLLSGVSLSVVRKTVVLAAHCDIFCNGLKLCNGN